MPDILKPLLQDHLIQPMSYYFAQFVTQLSNVNMDCDLALVAAILHESKQDGDICIDLQSIAKTYHFEQQDAVYSLPNVEQLKASLLNYGCVALAPNKQAIVIEGDMLYIGKLWHFEQFLAEQILNRAYQKPQLNVEQTRQSINVLFGNNHNFDGQKLSAAICARNAFSVISGGPGTGKTTTIIKVIAMLLEQDANLRIQLCAPTGKAAIRMVEAINQRKTSLEIDTSIKQLIPDTAKTIHRLLAYHQGRFRHNQNNPLTIDVLIIDEASMIDLELMVALFAALPSQCKVILLGDKDQLSSVEAGHVFNDLCGRSTDIHYDASYLSDLAVLSNMDEQLLQKQRGCNTQDIPLISHSIALLSQSYRFNAQSGIGQLALCINKGEGEKAMQCFNKFNDELTFFNSSNDTDIASGTLDDNVVDLILQQAIRLIKAKNVHQALNFQAQFQVLCATNLGAFGVAAMNQLVIERLQMRQLISNTQLFNGQTIIINNNDYENDLFNGDVGVVWSDHDRFFAYFKYSDSIKRVAIAQLKTYDLAWAITVHKSQGSEYDSVLLLLPNQPTKNVLKREWLYTAVTRAKSRFAMYSEPQVFIDSCTSKTQRQSQLNIKLGWKKQCP